MDRDRYRQRWDEADALLSAALDVRPEQRRALVLARTANDPELQEIVLSLLSNLDTAGVLLPEDGASMQVGMLGALVEDLEMARNLPVGQFVDRYRLVREIGRGGTGTVTWQNVTTARSNSSLPSSCCSAGWTPTTFWRASARSV